MFRKFLIIFLLPVLSLHLVILADISYKDNSQIKSHIVCSETALLSNPVLSSSASYSPEKVPVKTAEKLLTAQTVFTKNTLRTRIKTQRTESLSFVPGIIERTSHVIRFTADL